MFSLRVPYLFVFSYSWQCYTKHYFEEGNRICSSIGSGGFSNIFQHTSPIVSDLKEINSKTNQNAINTYKNNIGVTPYINVTSIYPYIFYHRSTLYKSAPEAVFYYHTDHLGSATLITDDAADVVQQIAYLPYGEDWVDIRHHGYFGSAYKFNGKEKDDETGYSYYGARYYTDRLSIWLSVDPLTDKYPSLSGYNYCANNPVMLVDPDGRSLIPPMILAYYAAAKAMEFRGNSSRVRQAGYAMQHPINAARVGKYKPGSNNISTIASNFQVNVANAAGLSTGGEGDQGNAFRHVIWQGIITNEMGEYHAKRIGNAHEDNLNIDLDQRTFKNMAEADKAVDLLNNIIGREIGEQNKGVSNKTMARKVAKEFYDNGLWTASQNKDGSVSIQRTKITKEQYDAAIKEINEKGNNGLNQ